MGSFIGHAVPGLFFTLMSIWWMVQMFRRYFQSIKSGTTFNSTMFLGKAITVKSKKINVEAILLIGACMAGMTVEIPIACILRGRPISIGNIQHFTMYFCFGIPPLLGAIASNLKFFPHLEDAIYSTSTFGLFVEGLLFKFHLFDRDGLDVLVHTLLIYSIGACVVSTIAEMMDKTSIIRSLCRAYFIGIQGLWFWGVAFILYNPIPGAKGWDSENHHQLMWVTAIFVWTCTALLVIFIVTGLIIGKSYKIDPQQMSYSHNSKMNGYKQCKIDEDNNEESHCLLMSSPDEPLETDAI